MELIVPGEKAKLRFPVLDRADAAKDVAEHLIGGVWLKLVVFAPVRHIIDIAGQEDQVHHEFIAAVLHTEPPLSAAEQREGFQAALSGALDDSFNMEVVQAVHEQLLDKIEQHKESKDPEPLTVSVQEVAAILKDCGVADTQVAAFEAQCGAQFGDGAVLNPENIIDSKHFEVKTSDASVAIDPKRSYIVETRIIDGRKYLLIPADEGVEVNGMAVGIAAADRRA